MIAPIETIDTNAHGECTEQRWETRDVYYESGIQARRPAAVCAERCGGSESAAAQLGTEHLKETVYWLYDMLVMPDRLGRWRRLANILGSSRSMPNKDGRPHSWPAVSIPGLRIGAGACQVPAHGGIRRRGGIVKPLDATAVVRGAGSCGRRRAGVGQAGNVSSFFWAGRRTTGAPVAATRGGRELRLQR